MAILFVEKCIRPFYVVSVCVCVCVVRGGNCQTWERRQFFLSRGLSWNPGAYGGIVLGAVRAWLLGRTVATLPTQYYKHVV